MASTERVTLRCSAIVFRNNHVLLVRRVAHSDWVLPGGNPETGESVASCARREVAEETGLQITVDRVAFVLEAHSEADGTHLLDLVFTATEVDRGAEPREREPGLIPEFRPVSDLATATLRPPIAGHIGGLHRRGGRGEGAYLGNVWRPHEPVRSRANAALDEWEF
jgi:8-oxo-dGTP diphosphatase